MKKQWLLIALVCAGAGFGAILGLMYILPLDLGERAPVQPIMFSHKLHAGTNGIACLYCHREASRSRVAGIPSVADCRACHRYIAGETPQIKVLMGYWDRQETIPWVRVHSLPDHVHFPHMMHIRSKIACSVCHGDVAGMERIRRTVSLKMGWCLECHRQYKASIDCWTCHK